jgi:hypothetical protein
MVVTLLKGLPKLAKKGWKQKRIDALSKAIEKVEKTNPNRLSDIRRRIFKKTKTGYETDPLEKEYHHLRRTEAKTKKEYKAEKKKLSKD